MAEINKSDLTERDICTKFITPAVVAAGWDMMTQTREEVYFSKGRWSAAYQIVTSTIH